MTAEKTTIDKALKTYLLSSAELSNIVGQRIFVGVAPENTKAPYICIYRISPGHLGDVPYKRPRYQISNFAPSYSVAREMAQIEVDMLERYKGMMGEFPVANVTIDNEQGDYENNTKLHQIAVDVFMMYQDRVVVNGTSHKIE